MSTDDPTIVPRIIGEPVQMEQCLDEGQGEIARVHVATLPPDFYALKSTDFSAALRAAAQEPPPTVEQRLATLEQRVAALETERE